MAEERVPAFDFRRWGGGIVTVGTLLVVVLVTFVEGIFDGSAGLQVVGAACLGGGIALFAVKIGEEIRRVRAKRGIEGEVGAVVNEVRRGIEGIVMARSELWFATSETPLDPGTNVRVTRVGGLLAWVRRLEEDEVTP